ncbi:Short C-terminal domain-containing protein [Lachnospiraceae bacterium XBB2008]|nr:Short C-terminal domain-containing protein [Lachnospiraceae bacterium XBB2008]
MGIFILVLLVLTAICFVIYKAIDTSQSNNSYQAQDAFLSEVRKMCEDNDITYQEPDFRKTHNGMGYAIDYYNGVSVDAGSKGLILGLYWIDKDNLCFVGRGTGAIKIPLSKIEMYTFDGSVQYISKIKNDGKNVSFSGALVGGLVAGEAGMIIGATKDRNQISTEVEEKDDRKVYVYYRDENDETQQLIVSKSLFNESFHFDEFIKSKVPTKRDTYLLAHTNSEKKDNSAQETAGNNVDINSLEPQLAKLKELYENKLISEEEYDLKRKKILNL